MSLLQLILNRTCYSEDRERVRCTQSPLVGVPLCFCLPVFVVERCSINCGAIALKRGCADIRCKIECMNRKSINLFDGAHCLFKMLPAKVWGANRCCLFKWDLMKSRFPGVTHSLILNYKHLTERHYACAFYNKSDSVNKCSPFKCTIWETLQQYPQNRIQVSYQNKIQVMQSTWMICSTMCQSQMCRSINKLMLSNLYFRQNIASCWVIAESKTKPE